VFDFEVEFGDYHLIEYPYSQAGSVVWRVPEVVRNTCCKQGVRIMEMESHRAYNAA
jgi:hypothetical protein